MGRPVLVVPVAPVGLLAVQVRLVSVPAVLVALAVLLAVLVLGRLDPAALAVPLVPLVAVKGAHHGVCRCPQLRLGWGRRRLRAYRAVHGIYRILLLSAPRVSIPWLV